MKRLVLCLLLAAACGKKEAPPPAAPAVSIDPRSVALVTSRYITTGPRLTGTLQPQQSAAIAAETGGTVVAVNAAEGSTVSRGTVLARIADDTAADALRSAQTAVQSAQTALTVSRRDLDRSTTLASAGALPKRDVDVARSQVAAAEAQLGQARAQLAQARDRIGDQEVVSSVSGIVSEKHASAGDVVAPGAPLFTIVDLTTLQLEASIPSDSLGSVNPGDRVDLKVRGHGNEPFIGTVSRIAPTVDAATGQVRVYVSVRNQGRRLIGGLFAEGHVTVASRMSLTVPVEAVEETDNSAVVTRIRNNVTERVNVRLGMRNDSEGFVEVISGLDDGDRVLVGPSRTIAPGTKVTLASQPTALFLPTDVVSGGDLRMATQ